MVWTTSIYILYFTLLSYCELLIAERRSIFKAIFYLSCKNLELDCSNTPREGLCMKEMYTSMERESTTVTVTMDQSMKPEVFTFYIYLESLGKNYLTLLVLFIHSECQKKGKENRAWLVGLGHELYLTALTNFPQSKLNLLNLLYPSYIYQAFSGGSHINSLAEKNSIQPWMNLISLCLVVRQHSLP